LATLGLALTAGADAAKPPGPCSLVTPKQMQVITHLHVAKEVLAPLGPTCIYTFRTSRSEITVAVEARSFSSAVGQMTTPKRVAVHGSQGYCGTLGLPTLVVPLPDKKVLTVVARCSIAREIGAIAVARLKR